MSRSSGLFRRLRNRVLGFVVVGAGFAACRPDRLLEDRSGNGSASSSSTSEARPSPRRPASSRAPEADGAAPTPPPSASAKGTSGSVHLALGAPRGANPADEYLMIKPQYALSYNPKRNVANWVSWNLDASYFGPVPRYKGRFLVDTSLPADVYRVQDRDYVGSGFDRGHLVRSEERTRTPEDNTATFLLPNILPQRHDLNAGPWLRLEDYCQALSQKEDKELYITAGGIFSARPETIGRGVAVPEHCFKIVVVLDRGQGLADVNERTRVISVIMPNTTGILAEPWGHYRISVRDVEKRTGHGFLTAVPEPIRRALGTRVDTGPVR